MRFKTVVELGYSYQISALNNSQGEEGIKRLVRTWQTLNEMSYSARYNAPYEPSSNPLTSKHHKPDPFQLLVSLKCIQYNIEMSEIESAIQNNRDFFSPKVRSDYNGQRAYANRAMEVLQWLISEQSDLIISECVPQYKAAKWGSL